MRYEALDAVVWYAGFVCVMAIITACLGLFAALLYCASEKIGRRLLLICRMETARYWVSRMEKEGLTAPQLEYRRMIKERNPKKTADFAEIDKDVRAGMSRGGNP